MKTTFGTILLSILTSAQLTFAAAPPAGGHPSARLYPPKQPDLSLVETPQKVSLLEPKYMAKVAQTTVQLKWAPVETATSYRIQVASDANFKWIISETLSQEATNLEIKNLEKGKQYFWRVAGVKRDNDPTYMQGPFVFSMFEVTP